MERQSKFSREEKIAAVKLVTEGGRTTPSVANEYGIHENTLGKWKRQYATNPEDAFTEAGSKAGAPDETERLRRRVRELENEVEFLKKVSAYFAKHPQ
jgi:transposase